MATENTTNDVQISFTPEYEVVGAEPMKLMFNAHLSAPLVVEDVTKRSTISLTAVIDKSGSMRGAKLELVKKTCNFMLNQLSNTDKMGLVEYDTHVNELIPLSQANATFKAEAASVINKMKSGSCTNLSGGLFEGVKQQQGNKFVNWENAAQQTTPEPMQVDGVDGEAVQAPPAPIVQMAQNLWDGIWSNTANTVQQQAPQRRSRQSARTPVPRVQPRLKFFPGKQPEAAEPVEEDALRSIFLFTDGLANEGITNTEELVSALGSILDGTPRVRVYTFGFGEDHSPALLAELARVGAGTYYFMEKEESIPTAFADALGGLLSVAAQNVTVEFRPAAGVTVSAVHSGFGSAEGAGGARRIAVGDLLSEEGKDLLVELALPAWEGEGAGAELTVGTLAVSYLDVQAACLRRQELPCTVQRARAVPAEARPNEGVALQRARVETAAGLAEARRAAESGDLGRARVELERCLGQVEAVASASAFKTQLCQDLREAHANMRDHRTYASRGSKLIWAKGKAHAEQRSACLSDSEGEDDEGTATKTFSYANVQQKVMRSKAKRECR